MAVDPVLVARWSAAIRTYDPLEPWLTESGWDESYWDDVATRVATEVGDSAEEEAAVGALRQAFATTFPDVELRSDNGLYRDNLDERLRRIAALGLRH